MKSWPQKLKKLVLATVLTCSFLALVSLGFGETFTELDSHLRTMTDPAQIAHRVIGSSPEDAQETVLAKQILSSKSHRQREAAVQSLRDYVHAVAGSERLTTDKSVLAQVKQIKASPLYRDESVQSANWFGKAGQALYDMIKRLLSFKTPETKGINAPNLGFLGVWVVYLVWAILAGLVMFLLWIAVRHARWKKRLKKKLGSVLEDDEPDRTVDEWLERADQLEAQGQYRDAVRCLYLACLLRFDEAGVARFDRGQTNWEHLARIQSSPIQVRGIDFSVTTRAFDHVWYGMHTRGKPDVIQFREWYLEITNGLMKVAA